MSPSRGVPAAEVLWRRWQRFMGQWGNVRPSAEGLVLTCSETGQVTEVRLSKEELHRFVDAHVKWRLDHGFDNGMADGLPLLLRDSFGEWFGSQQSAYAKLALVGLEFQVVSKSRHGDSE